MNLPEIPLKQEAQDPALEHICCIVRRKVFFAPDSGYSVFTAVRDDNQQTITVNGSSFEVSEGIHLDVEGSWKEHATYGRQFEAVSWMEIRPETLEGIEKYLASGKIKGIGKAFAHAIVERFGHRTFEVIQNTPYALRDIKGLGDKRIKRASDFMLQQNLERDVMVFLSGFGISYVFVKKIIKAFGAESVRRVRENPYCLIERIDGISFAKADEIAKHMGYADDDPRRLQSGIIFVMSQLIKEGHVYILHENLVREAEDILHADSEQIETAIAARLHTEDLIEDGTMMYLPEYYDAECFCARRIARLGAGSETRLSHSDEEIVRGTVAYIRRTENMQYDAIQVEAIRQALRSRVMILTGGPGTGKTTVLKGILHALRRKDLSIAVCAPTGRAAKRAKESTGYDAKTIHRTLEFSPETGGFQRGEENPLEDDVIIVDESSMVDILLFHSLLKAIPPYKRLILVGDVDQLPSVGAGNVLSDLITSGLVPVVRLTTIHRQDFSSRIPWNAKAVIEGRMPNLTNRGSKDFFFIEGKEEQPVADQIVELVSERLPKAYGVKPVEIQVLCPMRQRGLTSCNNLNKQIQEKVNPEGEALCYGETHFRKGDRVMQMKNNYDKAVFNGDVGLVSEVNEDMGYLMVDYSDDHVVKYEESDLDELQLSYASTIHKSQGSEYPTVIVPVMYSAYKMLQRNLIYTAITRAKERCIIIGNKQALWTAVSNYHIKPRHTYLKERILKCSNMTTNIYGQ